MLLDFIFIGIVFGCGYALGEFVTVHRVHTFLIRISRKAGIDLEREVDNEIGNAVSVPKLSTEMVDDIIYLYDMDDKTFICQGKTIEELAKLTLDISKIEQAIVLHDKSIFVFDNGTAHRQ
jgi:hypothetical protein